MQLVWLFVLVCVLVYCPAGMASEESRELALEEYERALSLTPDLENGKALYKKCAVCHNPEGWGHPNGIYPQIAGQLENVIIKQLADIRAGNRGNPMMYPFTTRRVLGGAQEIADVAAYVAQLKMSPQHGRGPRVSLEAGRGMYQEYCADCHGEQGEGDVRKHIPVIYGQHFEYLRRQFHWIRIGRRKNADEEMVEQIRNFTPLDVDTVLGYVSWMSPPAEKLADDMTYTNPDFASFARSPAATHRSTTQRLPEKKIEN